MEIGEYKRISENEYHLILSVNNAIYSVFNEIALNVVCNNARSNGWENKRETDKIIFTK